MRCREAAHRLQLYIDGRLTVEQTRVLETHISHCPACQEELFLLEEVSLGLDDIQLVAEPANLTASIMQRVATMPRESREQAFSPLRPSLRELLTAIFLATVATLGILLQLPALRGFLVHNIVSITFMNVLRMLTTMDSGTLTLAFWIIGTILGISITLALAGDEMRAEWFKAVMERIPVR